MLKAKNHPSWFIFKPDVHSFRQLLILHALKIAFHTFRVEYQLKAMAAFLNMHLYFKKNILLTINQYL